jgi:predicted nucleic acid-binding protein
MIVVADSSPFVVLIAIGHVDALPALFKHIVIPPEVQTELASAKRPESVQAFIASPPPWLEVRKPTSADRIKGLHAGEAAAITLAQELRADRIILDDEAGRKAASEKKLTVVGTVGILEAAAARNLIDLADAFQKVKKTDFWVKPAFLDSRLTMFQKRTHAEVQNRKAQEPHAKEQLSEKQTPEEEQKPT